MGQSTSNEGRRNDRGNALPKREPPDVTRFKSAAAKRVQAHRAGPHGVAVPDGFGKSYLRAITAS